MIEAFPLAWPQHRLRTKLPIKAAFNTRGRPLTVADAIGRLQGELDRLGASGYVLSSNLQLRLDGLPRSGQAEPLDRGVALYFNIGGEPHCLPCDRYDRVADNVAAIAKHIEATRAIERYGVANLKEMFAGFTALPSPGAKKSWREVFGYHGTQMPTAAELNRTWRNLAGKRHPDAGGSHELMAELNAARAEALKEIKG
ncbi:hypothetical protein [Rhizobium sp. LC145]|uniref:hypothetical protein n=1 Tax=Rhizobium sp. LC145 TaxID=1120688 RepID=UPI000629EF4E|nr:hypothetical protein [Rhizobium sp. LC145]KKX25337.1 molecular chaperone DnaJ [Rhizobium sp. LC145]TKT45362.1 J domain-containing protein [Rhizobiaceae bacterium LC148]